MPASTFKILNSLIGLETEVISDENFMIRWDGNYFEEIPEWNQDQTLTSAFTYSVVWYYQEIARRIGAEKMKHFVELTGYGNSDITGNIDSFWLDGNLRISAEEQIDFIRRLYLGDLPFSKRNTEIVKKIMIREQTDDYILRGKTGSAVRSDTYTGWFAGYLEQAGNVYFFATNIETKNPQGYAGITAMNINRDILVGMELLPVNNLSGGSSTNN